MPGRSVEVSGGHIVGRRRVQVRRTRPLLLPDPLIRPEPHEYSRTLTHCVDGPRGLCLTRPGRDGVGRVLRRINPYSCEPSGIKLGPGELACVRRVSRFRHPSVCRGAIPVRVL